MKKSIFLIFIFFLFFIGCNSSADLKYPYKSGIIIYSINDVGFQIYYFDDYGKKEARVLMDSNGKEVEGSNILPGKEINVDGYLIAFNPIQKTGTKTISKGSLSGPLGLIFSKLEARSGLDYKELGEDMILGKKVQGYSCRKNVSGIKAYNEIWLFDNIPLFIKLTFPDEPRAGMMSVKATKIETNVLIPEGIFNVPSDIILKDIQ
jgi:hypothetical protein